MRVKRVAGPSYTLSDGSEGDTHMALKICRLQATLMIILPEAFTVIETIFMALQVI
jgi:hypothetical protein